MKFINILVMDSFLSRLPNIFSHIWLGLLIYLLVVIYFVLVASSMEILETKKIGKWHKNFYSLLPIINIIIAIKAKYQCEKLPTNLYKKIFKPKELLIKSLLYGQLVFMVVVVLIPIIYVIGASLSSTYGITQNIFPDKISFGNFKTLFKETHYLRWYWHSFQIAILNMIASVILTTGTAYIFSRFKFKGKKVGLIVILVLQMFPSFMTIIALFTLYKTFGLVDKPLTLVIVYATGQIPFNTWLVKGYLSSIPRSLDESARIDGANALQIFTKIIFPLSVPILTFVAVTQFMAPWMDYMLANILLVQDKNYTLAVGLYKFITSKTDQNYTMFAAGALLVALPIGLLYVGLQKFLIEGITAGANKG